ncbi:FecCD family ABC transporter permease [Aromatoleum bremense]|uniref:Iron chelate uptake ABC transporter family permease subunit n=1 Tax=Aromatoleum bremense TaxID=76115 RepID=A0ABX1NWN8_9RHOO|nr:iron ABC transporter permease [Aromatoleum bremense]NMG15902.1 iron chelate uptake ABC transporter family permease subunit [Aromatoleum bremense]QTQ32454.1 ABC transporter, permease protein, BtuC-like [Aromatoleum bremense]
MRRAPAALPVIAALLAAGCLAIGWALSAGDLRIPLGDVVGALFGGADGMAASVVRELRLPRAVAVFACGGLLAIAGALMQVLLRNPLADPYVLGISGGAAVGALGAMLLGLAPWLVDAAAFAGALGAMLLVFGLAHGDGSWTQTRLLLTGVIVAAGCGAAVTLMLSLATDTRLQSMLFWLMGDASGASRPWPALVLMVVGLVAVLPFARDLNVLARGELSARALGVRVERLRYLLYVLASLLTAAAVTLIGSVGFVGLIVPHLVRFVIGNDQRVLLPAAMLAGGTLLTVADTAARTVIAPMQLPVGVLTALIGVPVFLFLLSRHPR